MSCASGGEVGGGKRGWDASIWGVQTDVREGGKTVRQANKVNAGSASRVGEGGGVAARYSLYICWGCILPADACLSIRHLPSPLLHMHSFEEKPLNSQTG